MTTSSLPLHPLTSLLWLALVTSFPAPAQPPAPGPDLWTTAKAQANIHRFSTLFDAQSVDRMLSTDEDRQKAIDWCKQTAVTKVYIESFRGNHNADPATLRKAKEKFLAEGFEVSGCVTTTRVGKKSNGWGGEISCYTDQPTQEKLDGIFERAAALFDEIMIDDFWFSDCRCDECDAARKAKLVKVGQKTFPVSGDTWEDYHCELLVRLSRDRVLAPARRVNPKVRIIIKYPQWYDNFHERGYEVVRETADFDRIWVGTETRDYTDKRWGGTPQYEAFFIMRWLGGIGGAKCGGGWFDPFGTTENTYLEQARQTVLGGAAESMLFCYPALQRDTGPKNVAALRKEIPELLAVAREVRSRTLTGIAAYKPANSHPEKEPRVFDFVGMLGLPLVPCHEFPAKAPAAFFSVHALKDADLAQKLTAFISSGKPVLVTDGLTAALSNRVDLAKPNVSVLPVRGDPKSLLALSTEEVTKIRGPLLKALKVSFDAPPQVALYLFSDGSWVAENFTDEPAPVALNGTKLQLPARAWQHHWN